MLSRLETAVNDGDARNDQTLGRIESDLKNVMEFLPTVRADMNDLSAKLDALKADIQALPH